MKYQVLFSLKNNEKYLRLSSSSVMIHALRLKFFSDSFFFLALILNKFSCLIRIPDMEVLR